MPTRFTIVGIGEAVFDLFPGQRRLGGAPLNVAAHAHQLAQPHDGRGVIVSRVGQDDLGRQLIDQVRQRGLTTDYIQTDPDRPTGRIYVEPGNGSPTYDIEPDAAWDVLQFDPDDEDLALHCDAICFGTLAQRDAQSRNAIHRFLDTARRAHRLFDVNLRSAGGRDFFDQRTIERSLDAATAVKLNEEELTKVTQLLGLPGLHSDDSPDADHRADDAAAELLKRYDLTYLALTRGPRGTVLYTDRHRHEAPPPQYPADPEADAVGAGDACAAALLVGQLLRLPPDRLVDAANHVGAFVASQPGAVPALPESILSRLRP